MPGRRVDDRPEALRQDAAEIAGDAAARDVGEPTDVGARAQGADLVEVEARRRQQQVGIEGAVADDPPDEREAVRVDPGRGEADDCVTVLDPRPVDDAFAFDDADGRAAEVDLVLAIDARQLGRLATEDRAAGGAADVGGALDSSATCSTSIVLAAT